MGIDNDTNIVIKWSVLSDDLYDMFCGQVAVQGKEPWCINKKKDIDLGKATVAGGIKSYAYTPEGTAFCKVFEDKHDKYNKFCLPMLPEATAKLKDIIAKAGPGAPNDLYDYNVIHNLIVRDDRGMSEKEKRARDYMIDHPYFSQRTKKFYNTLEDLKKLKPTDVEFWGKKQELTNLAVKDVCIVDNKSDIETADSSCTRAILTDTTNWGRTAAAGAWLFAKISLGLATLSAAVTALAWAGRGPEARDAARAAYRSARSRGSGRFASFFEGVSSILKLSRSTVPEVITPPPSQSTPGPAPAIIDTTVAGEGSGGQIPSPSTPAGLLSSGPSTVSGNQPTTNANSATFNSDADVGAVVQKVGEAMKSLAALAPRGEAFGASLEGIIGSGANDKEKAVSLANLFFDRQTVDLIYSAIRANQNHLHEEFIPGSIMKLADVAPIAGGGFDRGEKINEAINEIEKMIKTENGNAKGMVALAQQLKEAAKSILNVVDLPREKSFVAQQLDAVFDYQATVAADAVLVISSISPLVNYARINDAKRFDDNMKDFDLTSAGRLFHSAEYMSKYDADRRGVKILVASTLDEKEDVAVPPEMRRNLLVMLLHTIDNAIKYTKDGVVTLVLTRDDAGYYYTVMNDAGEMSDERLATKLEAAFVPDGEGMGISKILKLGTEIGVGVSMQSHKNGGMLVGIDVPVTQVSSGPGPDRGTTPVAPKQEPGAAGTTPAGAAGQSASAAPAKENAARLREVAVEPAEDEDGDPSADGAAAKLPMGAGQMVRRPGVPAAVRATPGVGAGAKAFVRQPTAW